MGTARTRRTPVPPVEPTDDVAPLVDETALAAPEVVDEPTEPTAAPSEPVEPSAEPEAAPADVDAEPVPPTRFVVALHAELGAHAVLARTALPGWPGWAFVEDLPDDQPPALPDRFRA